MNYDFNTLKSLYDKYRLEQNSKTGNQTIIDKTTDTPIDTNNSELKEYINFAHAWYNATKESLSTPNQNTKDDYEYAWNDSARKTYTTIMSTAITGLLAFGKMYNIKTLQSEVSELTPSIQATKIIESLYSNQKDYQSFEYWSRKAACLEQAKQEIRYNNNTK